MSLFTRSIPDRFFCAFLSLLLMAPTGWGLYTYFTISHADDDPDWVLRLLLHVVMEIVGAAFLLSVLGIVWAAFTPRWLARATHFCLDHFVLGLCAFLVLLIGLLVFSSIV